MAISERIKYFRTLRGATLKWLGKAVGFPDRTADVRMAQYEAGTRKPKADLTAAIADALEVSPAALSVPDIDNFTGLIHTLFALEDLYGLRVAECDGDVCLKLDKEDKLNGSYSLYGDLQEWLREAKKLEEGKITKAQYDQWRYNYPKFSEHYIN